LFVFGISIKHSSAIGRSTFILTGADIFAAGQLGSFRTDELISETPVFTFAGAIPLHGEGWVFRAGRDTIFIESWFTEVLFGISGVKGDNRQYSVIFE